MADESQPPGAPRRQPSVAYQAPRLQAAGVPLCRAEAAFFVAHGFLVKRGLVGEAAIDSALERIWAHLLDRVPQAGGRRLRPDQPATWMDPRWAATPPTPKAGPHAGRLRTEHRDATVKLHDLGGADFLLRLVPNNPALRVVATALLGDLRPSRRARGVYAVFPKAAPLSGDPAQTLAPHTDQVCQQLNLCVYLDDVPPRGGGFTLYPGSHRAMFEAHRWHANWSPLPGYKEAVERVAAATRPLELVGAKGDAVFWHGRAVHSAGIHAGRNIRWAVFADFTQDRPVLNDDEHRAAGQYEWFKDAKLFRDDAPVASGNAADEAGMWRGWRLGGHDLLEGGRGGSPHAWRP